MKIQLLIITLLLSITSQSFGQTKTYRDRGGNAEGGGFNYYDLSKSGLKNYLTNVERNHLILAIKDQNATTPSKVYALFGNLSYTLRKFPNHPDALATLSTVAIAHGKEPMAEKFFEEAIKRDSRISTTYMLYGIFKYKTGELDKAVELYSKAVKLSPKSAEAQYNLGLGYYKLGDMKNARKHAGLAYQYKHPLPGLKNLLKKANAW